MISDGRQGIAPAPAAAKRHNTHIGGIAMERRAFLKGALAIFGAATVGTSLMSTSAEAATPDLTAAATPEPAMPSEEVARAETDELDAEGQYYIVRRRRWRPRRRVYYYRPRRRVYYRPRRVYYRRRYYRPRSVYFRLF